ncbi:hypothetical protein IMCC3317_39080 [Kordia antarctica]|uniref:Secretion system C-terminal sorting domain-containing protein n=1 Tax=Kordia antarctica TaxID=1218801 RepID=A0A7L4ZPG7_9FLAO|nr:T9SS type A sorting domain-containing protein [Kordia antarctica]QHI38515.1 hypothetical protein IMCC3317_39080 [Kordia antarctica]
MKIKLLFLIFPLFIIAQSNDTYVDLKTVPSETGIVVTKMAPFSVLNADYEYYGMYNLLQSVNELNAAGLDFDSQTLEKSMRTTSYNETIKIGGIHTTFETIHPEAISRNDVIVSGDGYKVRLNVSNIFQKKTKTIIASLTTHKRGLATSFYVDSNLFKNTTTNSISELRIDFGDGQDFRTIPFNTPIQISYVNAGKKTLTFNVRFANGEETESTSTLFVSGSNSPENMHTVTATIDPALSIYSGVDSFPGMGEYEIFLGADNSLDKPIIVIDGFDPDDTRDINAIYDLLTYTDAGGATQNLGDRIRADEDFDIVILNLPQYLKLTDNTLQLLSTITDTNGDLVIDETDYPVGSTLVDGGADFIERNAMTLVQLITTINSQKVGNEENVIIGPSMGGLISRYALKYMEDNSLSHDTRLWISFDAPHLGANVPIGFQHLFNYLAYGLDTWVGNFSVVSLRPVVDGMLKSPAARQMLTDHMESHLQSGQIAEFDDSVVLPQPHPYFDLFFNRLNGTGTSGYPENLRKVTMINGSGFGNPYLDKMNNPILPGRQVLDALIEDVAFLTDVHLKVWYGPTSGTTAEVSDIWVDAPVLCFCDIYADADSRAESFSNGIDAAMGGLFDLGALSTTFTGGDPTIDAFFMNLQTDYFNFIPTISSMALKNQNNWYAIPTPTTAENVNETPFDAWHMPVNNENHISLSPENVNFAWNEIVNNSLGINDNIQDDFIIVLNPVKEQLILNIPIDLTQLAVSIYDISGRLILEKNIVNTSNNITIPMKLNAGMYILQLGYNDKIQVEKVIVH